MSVAYPPAVFQKSEAVVLAMLGFLQGHLTVGTSPDGPQHFGGLCDH